MSRLDAPYDEWQPGESRIRHHERHVDVDGRRRTRIERWEWEPEARDWKLTAVFAGAGS